MRAIITGANGTVGKALSAYIESIGGTAIAWDRHQVPIDDYAAMEAFVAEHQPDALFHLAVASQLTGYENEHWLVNWQWPSELAWITRQLDVAMVFTSSVMVYREDVPGPRTIKSNDYVEEGYGGDKRRAEERVLYQNPAAKIARLGWQIGDTRDGNQMVAHLYKQRFEHGQISASTKWLPACSLLPDTAAALVTLARDRRRKGVYLIDSNQTGWSYHQIVTALNKKLNAGWNVRANQDFVYDQRMLDTRLGVSLLEASLPLKRK